MNHFAEWLIVNCSVCLLIGGWHFRSIDFSTKSPGVFKRQRLIQARVASLNRCRANAEVLGKPKQTRPSHSCWTTNTATINTNSSDKGKINIRINSNKNSFLHFFSPSSAVAQKSAEVQQQLVSFKLLKRYLKMCFRRLKIVEGSQQWDLHQSKWRKIKSNKSKKIKMVKFILKAHSKKMYMKIFIGLYCKIMKI